jgi:hypothetical protein
VTTNEHAAILRREARVRKAEHAVPLLAGAEALEAVEVAKAALEQIVNNRIGDVGRCGSRHCDCSECVARAALARLREIAAGNRRWAIAYEYETDPISQIRLNSLHEEAASLLAGAEALEAVEVAKAALDSIREYDDDKRIQQWATAALARLEGK